jgi:hypothetical protein
VNLWKYNRPVGRWDKQRECSDDEAAQWLQVFEHDAPGEHFRLSEKAPTTAPDGRQLPRLVKGRYVIHK